eukprot:CAMPEP_0182547066 /NCGR_PEP_ID=MMETSP1323-20130603/36959_1 /TAXON_ID=236787 /ORGANISM="Florenciella parvula, Strain RCC1693" /LENGTH=90 /DNA_ID=CAMNT_0024758345 /DNA_START=1 /DNA_END=273 /DNA_ORIENTATION=-
MRFAWNSFCALFLSSLSWCSSLAASLAAVTHLARCDLNRPSASPGHSEVSATPPALASPPKPPPEDTASWPAFVLYEPKSRSASSKNTTW